MRRPALLLSLLLVLGQIALGLHQIEHRLHPIALDQEPCGVCTIADHMGGAPVPAAILPSVAWSPATFPFLIDQRPDLARPGENRARAPPVSIA